MNATNFNRLFLKTAYILVLLTVCLVFSLPARAVNTNVCNATFNVVDFAGNSVNVLRLSVKPYLAGNAYGGSFLAPYIPDMTRASTPSLTNGTATVTNLYLDYSYTVRFYDGITNYTSTIYPDSRFITVGSTINAANFVSLNANPNGPNAIPYLASFQNAVISNIVYLTTVGSTNLSGFTSGDPTNNVLSDAGTNTVNAIINQNLSANPIIANSVTNGQPVVGLGIITNLSHIGFGDSFSAPLEYASVDLQTGQLQSYGREIMAFEEMALYDGTNNASLAWRDRWLADSSATITLDWQNKILHGSWIADGSSFTNLNSAQLTGQVPAAALTATTNGSLPLMQTNTPLNASQLPASVVTNVYNVKQFGAYGDAKFVSWVYASSNSVTLTSSFGQFASSDIGSTICISGGMTNDGFFVTGISNVISSTQIILSNAPQQNVTNSLGVQYSGQGSYAVYGKHDDTPAFQAAADQVTNGNARVYIPAGNYLLLGALKRTNDNNAQIVVPVPNANVSTTNFYAQSIPTLEFYGEDQSWFWGSVNGRDTWYNSQPFTTVLISPIQANGYLTNGMGASVIDGRAYNSGNASAYIYSSVGQNGWRYPDNPCRLVMHHMTIMTSYNSGMTAINSMGFAQGGFWDMQIVRNQLRPNYKVYAPTDTNSYGIILNGQYNGGDTVFDDMYVSGYYNGVDIGLMKGKQLVIEGCVNGISIHYTSPIQAACDGIDFNACKVSVDAGMGIQARTGWIEFSRVMFEGTTNKTVGLDSFGNYVTNNFGLWSLTNVITVNDPSNYLQGFFNYSYKNSGQPSSGLGIHKVGATNLNVTVETFNGLTHESAELFTNANNVFRGQFYAQDGTPILGATNVFYLNVADSRSDLVGFTGVTPVRAYNLGFQSFLGNNQITIPPPNNGNVGAWSLPVDKLNGKTHLDLYVYGWATNSVGQTNQLTYYFYLTGTNSVLESPYTGWVMTWPGGTNMVISRAGSSTLSGTNTYGAGTLSLYCNSTNGGMSVITLIRGEAY